MAARHRPIHRLRRVLLALLVLLAGALVALYLFGRAGRPGGGPQPRQGDAESPEGAITLIGEGFEFTHSEGERPVFRIRGDSVRADREGTVYLDGVGLTLYDEDGTGYEVAAERATYNRDNQRARLAGEVVLSGPNNTRLATRGMRLVERGAVLVSTGPVRFTFQQLQGRAENLRVEREQDVYLLSGDVVVESMPGAEVPLSLTAQRLVFEQQRHLVQAQNDVVLVRGEDRVEAGQINAFLDEEDREVLFLRARLDVAGDLASTTAGGTGAARRIHFAGRSLSLMRDGDGQLLNAELEGAPEQAVRIDSPSPDGTLQRLVAGYMVADFTNGALSQVRAFNEPHVVELAARGRGELRRLEGRRMEASFAADGRMVALTADEAVRFADADVRAEGDRATFDTLEETGVFTGSPVVAVSDRGELRAPQVTYERDAGLLHAEGGVRTLAQDAAGVGLDGTPLAEGEGPVRVESEEAFWRDQPRSALFRGEVRAWRGENLLLADAVRADQEGSEQTLTASGGVRTVWIPAPPADGAGAAEDGARAPVEVTGNTLTYRKPREVLVYEGNVRAEQARQALQCRRLEVELSEAGEAETLTCIGDARLDDRAAGNSARGERAVYDLTSRTVTMTGDPVTLRKSDGAQVQGGRVLYDLESGKARVQGEGAAAAAVSAPAAGTGDGTRR
jgi:lipopolysaccharide export system protein LptA